jgi:PPOX class probable F420-dependent enzyme
MSSVTMTPEQTGFLDSQRVARLATVDEKGRPHALPICFARVDDLLYTPIDEKPKHGDPRSLRRIRNILANPHVCLVVDHYEEDWSQLGWLQVRGQATLVEDADERASALAALRDRYIQYRAMDLESRPLIRITPEKIVGWDGRRRPTPRGDV